MIDPITLLIMALGTAHGKDRSRYDNISDAIVPGIVVSVIGAAIVLLLTPFGVNWLFFQGVFSDSLLVTLILTVLFWAVVFATFSAIRVYSPILLIPASFMVIALVLKFDLTGWNIMSSLITYSIFFLGIWHVQAEYLSYFKGLLTKKNMVTGLAIFATLLIGMWIMEIGIFSPYTILTPPDIDIVNIEIYSNQPVSPGSDVSVFVDFKNTADYYSTRTVEVCVYPDKWVSAWGLFTAFRTTTGCCPDNEFCKTMEVTLNPTSVGGTVIKMKVPDANSKDNCNNQGSAVDPNNKYWVVAGIIKSCYDPAIPESGGYYDYKLTPIEVQASSINCYTDAACGISGWSSGYYCSDNTIMRAWITYTCLNSGTPQSQCTSAVEKKEVDTCATGACVNGIGYCVGPEPICYNDGMCGTTGWITEPYCSGTKILRNWVTYECLNPGAVDAACKVTPEAKTLATCGGNTKCVNGAETCQLICDYDGECDAGENSENCQNDCPYPVCGDGECQEGAFFNCPSDCSPNTLEVIGIFALLGVLLVVIYLAIQKR